jgi:hypothetical protein
MALGGRESGFFHAAVDVPGEGCATRAGGRAGRMSTDGVT